MTDTHEKPWGSIHAVRAKGFSYRRPSRVPYPGLLIIEGGTGVFSGCWCNFTILKNDGVKVNGVGMTSHFYEMENNL